MPPILDVAIGTVFIFLLFSLVISALNELILSKFDQRAEFLQTGLTELLGGKDKAEALCKHGLINALSTSNRPSYIPAGAFVTALLDMVTKEWGQNQASGPQPNEWSEVNVALLTKLITDIQTSKAAKTLPTDFDTNLGNFVRTYTRYYAPPEGTGVMAEFFKRISESVARKAAQTRIGAAANPTDVDDAISDQPLQVQIELNTLRQQTADTLPAFKTAVQQWFDPARELEATQGAASGTLALLLKPAILETGETLKACIVNLPTDSKLRESLLSLLAAANGSVETFKTAVEGWFNATMDRASGWYKRFAQKWMIIFGFVLAAILNVDTIRIVDELSKNPNLAKAVAAQAEIYAKGSVTQKTWEQRKAEIVEAVKVEQDELNKAIKAEDDAAAATTTDAKTKQEKTIARKKAQDDLDKKRETLLIAAAATTSKDFDASIEKLRSTGIPMGWQDEKQRHLLGLDKIGNANELYNQSKARGQFAWWMTLIPCPWHFTVILFNQSWWAWVLYYPWVYAVNFWNKIWEFLPLIAGWFLTALAASLGAPFWFDTLNRFVNIRNSGRTPGEADATATTVKPPPATLDKTPK